MQLMTWALGRLGSRFSLMFEPYQKRVRHSAVGRFLDEPVDLKVGLVEPDGVERILPFSRHGEMLHNPEQFERINSITFRGYSPGYRLRFELNIHSVFYPQSERLCLLPVYYLEMRVSPAKEVRRSPQVGPTPKKVKLFVRLDRPHTTIRASVDQTDAKDDSAIGMARGRAKIDLSYESRLSPSQDPYDARPAATRAGMSANASSVSVNERIVSLNPGCQVDADGKGLSLELPVTAIGSGIKWRLVWGAHCGDSLLNVDSKDGHYTGRFRYTRYWPDLDAVIDEAVRSRDDWLAHSRRFEKLLDQAPLQTAQRHLVNQSFQSFLTNTFWCDLIPDFGQRDATAGDNPGGPEPREWFSVWDGSRCCHATVNVEYNVSMVYLALWPRLLALQLDQWGDYGKPHGQSSGSYLSHDVGAGFNVTGQAYPHDLPVEENCNFLLLMQAYSHWTGDLEPAKRSADLIERLARYLIWTDRDSSGFPSHGTVSAIEDAGPATQYGRMPTALAVKRLAAIQAAGDLLARVDRPELAKQCASLVASDAEKINQKAWLGDHYCVCVDKSVAGIRDVWTGHALAYETMPGWDAYSIYTGHGLLLPTMIGQPILLDRSNLRADLRNAARETLGAYGCGHSSTEIESVWISQNLWRDHLMHYLGSSNEAFAQPYWDLQVVSNTHDQSLGYSDAYVNNNLSFSPRGVTSIGYLLAYPRLVIDRLAPQDARVSVNPDRHFAQRWPLLPLADWKAGKIPVCVVDPTGRVTIEGESDPVTILGDTRGDPPARKSPRMIG